VIRAVIFDMDGTITRPYLNFREIRARIGVVEPLLENMLALPEGPERERAFRILEEFERDAAEQSQLNDDVPEVLAFLQERRIPAALVTRNSRRSVRRVLERHGLVFSLVVTREDAPAKPRPEPLWLICQTLEVPPAQTLMVGDFTHDVAAGRNAGTRTALLTNGRPALDLGEISPDHVLGRLSELQSLFPLRT
jgi:HAD superfamily hydrolase (TIGR01549 family)